MVTMERMISMKKMTLMMRSNKMKVAKTAITTTPTMEVVMEKNHPEMRSKVNQPKTKKRMKMKRNLMTLMRMRTRSLPKSTRF